MGIKRNKADCEKYQLDLTDYVTGDMTFLTKQKQQKLFAHLRKCQTCRQDFFDWEETFGVLATKEHHAKPKTQKRMNTLIEQFKSAPVKTIKGKPVLDNETEIGTPAGAVWRYLAKNGWVKVNDLTKNLRRTDKIDPDKTKFAVGWLLRENKAYYTKTKQDTLVYLAEHERQIYQQEQM